MNREREPTREKNRLKERKTTKYNGKQSAHTKNFNRTLIEMKWIFFSSYFFCVMSWVCKATLKNMRIRQV